MPELSEECGADLAHTPNKRLSMAEPMVVTNDTVEKSLTDVFSAVFLPEESVSYHRREKRGARSERRRGARTRVRKHPIRRHLEKDGRRGALRLLPPARWNLRTNRAGHRSTEWKNHTA